MEIVYTYTRFLHIAAGMVAFFVAPVALIVQKGGKIHRIWGGIFFRSMALVCFSAIPMTYYKPNLFLFLTAIFSFHLSLSRYRAILQRKSKNKRQTARVDISIATIAGICYTAFIAWGVSVFFKENNHAFGYIAIVFGLIGMRFSIMEVKQYFKPSRDKREWWYTHMQGMTGSYIATLSAFSTVNFYFLPDIFRWLWPTFIGVPLLIIWERDYKQKFTKSSLKAGIPINNE